MLDVMLGRDGALDDPKWAQPAIYSLESAITALWSGVGIRPDSVMGHGVGEISAAQAAGVFSLEDGMRLSLARGEFVARGSDLDGLQSTLESVQFSPPSVAMIGGGGEPVEPAALMDTSHWVRQANEAAPSEAMTSTLAGLDTDVAIEIGAGSGFARAVAKAYEAGLPISFEGMFTGEARRRISLPSYPFQRRRHWV